ncbi:hypothetical protein [Spiroplasma endosymbiont of Diplazon laetatorius]|uniref:hypothetical protein n=1 Tax=Spiroplasma endosymbiont of Diplazon laetatorius TaxID=3066322 RepID=UPI0030D547C0
MKKILPIFGLMTLGTTVPVSIVQNISSNKINNTTQSTFDLNNELSKRKSKCGDDLVIEYKSETNSLGRHVSTLYLDQWLVNAHYDWATREDSGIYNYNRVMYFLELTVPGFAHESDQYVKELITKNTNDRIFKICK